MNCHRTRDYLDSLLAAEPSPLVDQAVLEHIGHCAACRAEYDAAMATLALLQPSMKPQSTANLKETIMMKIATVDEHPPVQKAGRNIPFWKPALAAAAAIAVLSLVVYPVWRPAPSYAFAQTIDATRAVQSIHLRSTPDVFGRTNEVWAQFNEAAELVRLRMNFPDTEDGPKDVAWQNDTAEVWFKKKNCVTTVREPNIIRAFKEGYTMFDPALMVEDLYQKKADGSANVEVQEPEQPGDPIVLTVTDPAKPEQKKVYTVDSSTKLLLRLDHYQIHNGQDQLEVSTEYLDYNQVDPAAFTLEAPADVMRVDMTEGVGIEQGSLSDAEIATKVVREFFEALIAKDYAKASPLYSKAPPAELQRDFGRMNLLRIVSLGPPEPHPETGSLRVPCKIEYEVNGKTGIMERPGPLVREVHNRPGYWTIHGGI